MSNETPARELAGLTLTGGWVVDELLERTGDRSGGSFSVGYAVHRGTTRAFLKALDLNVALGEAGIEITSMLLGGQWTEAELLRRCSELGLNRIVTPYATGVWQDPVAIGKTPVPYIIMEWADGGDLTCLLRSEVAELQFAVGALHGIASGVQQLHTNGLAHLDIRPSNGLVVEGRAKLGDFGHARDMYSVGSEQVGGALAYAPPEILYGAFSPNARAYRAVDLYLLGSLVCSVLACRVPVTTLLVCQLDDSLHPNAYTGSLTQVLPFLRHAWVDTIDYVNEKVHAYCDADRVTALITMLSDPDPELRGHPRERAGSNDRFSLRRIVAELNLMYVNLGRTMVSA